jgi:galactokinase/mevalonate kinase-like predicted kinase
LASVETRGEGVCLESKDTLMKLEVRRVSDLPTTGISGLVRRVLLALDLDSGLQIATQARVPFEAGLGSAGALAVALAAAAARATGRPLPTEALAAFAIHGEGPAAPACGLATVRGGVVVARVGTSPSGGERLPVDPGRVEECLLLVDPASASMGPEATAGEAGHPEPERAALEEIAALARHMREALVGGRYGEIPALVAAEHEARLRLLPGEARPALVRLAALARENGGAARACGPGPGSLALVWAPPGERTRGPMEQVQAALKAAGYRSFPCRMDLRGLEVEEVECRYN